MSLGQCGGAGGFIPLPFGLPSSGLTESRSGILPLDKPPAHRDEGDVYVSLDLSPLRPRQWLL